MTHILVVGGAGYIGSHMSERLVEEGYRVTILDNLSTGHRELVQWGELLVGDLLDREALRAAFAGRRIDAVMHFAALSLVGDSMRDPYAYYRNNVTGTLNLLEAMCDAEVDRLVFSSTAAVYGNPTTACVDETHALLPVNPYGNSKLTVERLLSHAASAYGLRSMSLRYFNAAGASGTAPIGEAHWPETHLIPNILRAALYGTTVSIFGDDYPTIDGTCVRDYVHAGDLVDAHLRSLEFLSTHEGAHAVNLGNGQGFSVLQILEAARQITGRPIASVLAPRREGDPAVLVASSERARELLGWQAGQRDIAGVIESAWRWHSSSAYEALVK